MPVISLASVPQEFVTPKHSTAFGPLITGEAIEVGVLRYKAGEGAETHSHPHEQIIIMLSGKIRFTIDGEASVATKGDAVHVAPNVPHAAAVLEDAEVVSCKSIVGGVGHRI
jgi:quercetin dioxygenase-like cupin family protein